MCSDDSSSNNHQSTNHSHTTTRSGAAVATAEDIIKTSSLNVVQQQQQDDSVDGSSSSIVNNNNNTGTYKHHNNSNSNNTTKNTMTTTMNMMIMDPLSVSISKPYIDIGDKQQQEDVDNPNDTSQLLGTIQKDSSSSSSSSNIINNHRDIQLQQLQYSDNSKATTSTSTSTTTSTSTKKLVRLLFCTLGICICYICYGIFHEKLLHDQSSAVSSSSSLSTSVSQEQEHSKKIHLGPSFILFTQCIMNTIVAIIWSKVQSYLKDKKTTIPSSSSSSATTTTTIIVTKLPHRMLYITSFCYVVAMICSNEAIPHVSYPIAVLAKSCKLIPTMMIGQIISYTSTIYIQYIYPIINKLLSRTQNCTTTPTTSIFQQVSHTTNEWIAALCICIGIITFHYQNPSFHQHQQQSSTSTTTSSTTTTNSDTKNETLGIYLLCTSLLMDGILSVCQNILKKTKTSHSPSSSLIQMRSPNAVETMYYINIYALVFIGFFCYYTNQFSFLFVSNNNNHDINISSSSNNNATNIDIYRDTIHVTISKWILSIQPYTSMIQNLIILNVAAACGQIFIFITITWFTPVITTMITTTRKFITILLSVLLYGHSFTTIQWLCVMFIFLGLYIAIIGTTTKTTTSSSSTPGAIKSKVE